MPLDLTPDRNQRLADDFQGARHRLVTAYASRLGEGAVDSVMEAVLRQLDGARITDFVGLLVERLSREQLKTLASSR